MTRLLRTNAIVAFSFITTLFFSSDSVFAVSQPELRKRSADLPPAVSREFRGAWVTTVYNVDWPSKRTLSTAQQKAELIAILDRAAGLKLNAIVLQVRTECDAFYASPYEPWSAFLTGKMGEAPKPFYDPLAFAVEQAHQRGLELHAWINPFRARVSEKEILSAGHVARKYPQLTRKHGQFLWLDPGDKAAQDYTLRVSQDIIKRYDIDGFQIDDYFYPSTQPGPNGKALDFDDDATWKKYVSAGGKLKRDDWRRENVNTFVKRLYDTIKAEKSWVKFGISPPGIWRPHNPPQITGRDVYQAIYADSRKWLLNGWCDYFAPQLYWPIDKREQSYPVLLKWWTEQNPKHRHLWPGLATGNVGSSWKPSEIANQIQIARTQQGVSGHLHYHMGTLMKNPKSLATDLQRLYSEPALVPASPWLYNVPPEKPTATVRRTGTQIQLSWQGSARNQIRYWILQKRVGSKWTTQILPSQETSRRFSNGEADVIALTAVNRFGVASAPTLVQP
ncbi:MAG: hypothetical protein JWM68_2433 [Verrucomicrobiales bacterium]|nr:hypothetical protein [Verrucomicrobiales bacterium]